MRRTVAFALVLLAPLSAHAQSRVFDAATDPGVPRLVPNASDAASLAQNTACLQGILNREMPSGAMRLDIPSGTYRLAAPLFVGYDGVSLNGAGRELTTLYGPGSEPAVIAGLRPSYAGLNLTGYPTLADIVPDTTASLDGSVRAPAIGLKLRKGLHVSIPWQAWTCPTLNKPPVGGTATWSDVPAFTLEIAVDLGAGLPGNPAGIVCGASSGPTGYPFVLLYQQGAFTLYVSTTDGQTHKLVIPPMVGGNVGVIRLAVSADTVTGKMTASVNRVIAPVISPVTFVSGLRFSGDKSGFPFKVGGSAPTDGQQSDYFQFDPTFTFTLLGIRLSSVVRPIATSDQAAYRTSDASTIALLPLNDAPASVVATRVLSTLNAAPGSGDLGAAFLIDAATANPYATVKGFGLHNLTLRGGKLGHGLMTSASMAVNISDVTLVGGAIGWGSLGLGPNYVFHLTGRNIFGGVAWPVRLHGTIARCEGILQFGQPYPMGYGAIMTTASDFRCWDAEVLGEVGPFVTNVFDADGTFAARSLFVDNEATAPATWLSVVRCQLSKGNGSSLCQVDDLNMANLGVNAACVTLGSSLAPQTHPELIQPGWSMIGRVVVQGQGKTNTLIRVTDPRWKAVVPVVTPPIVGP